MSLKGKRVLITAGPTWVPIDTVRVISNTATGETGALLAERLQIAGAKVTLLLGPVNFCGLDRKIRLLRFKFFDELRRVIAEELASRKYDIVIHAAAVSDYRPRTALKKKIGSGIKQLTIKLIPTSKIIDTIKKRGREICLVGFKFEPDASRNILLSRAKGLMARSKLDLAVANTVNKGRYQAYIVSARGALGPFKDKKDLTGKLIEVLTNI